MTTHCDAAECCVTETMLHRRSSLARRERGSAAPARRAALTAMSCALGAVALAGAPDEEPPLRPALHRYQVDPARSEVGFDGTSTLHDFTGRTRDVSGQVFVDFAHPTTFVAGQIECRAASLDTDNGSRDEKMREHLDVAHFPTITFSLARAEGERAAAREVDVAGSFAIHGVQREYHVTTTTERGSDGSLHVRGRAPVKLRDHGIVPPAVVMIEVGEVVQVWFDLVLAPAVEPEAEARAHLVTVEEVIAPVGGAETTERHSEALFLAGDVALWERAADGQWVRGAAGSDVRCTAVATAAALPRPATAEESFAEARDTITRMQEKLDKLDGARREKAERAVADTLARLTSVLAEAPAEGALVRQSTADGEAWLLGDRVWLELHGRRGDGRFVPLLASLEGLPTAVRDALAGVDGVPERVVVRTATMGGVRTLAIELGAGRPGLVPRTAVTEGGVAR